MHAKSLYISLNHAVIDIMLVDNDLAQRIKTQLPNDPDIDPYLEQPINKFLLRDEEIIFYLKFFSLYQDKLILHNELVYISINNEIKIEIL